MKFTFLLPCILLFLVEKSFSQNISGSIKGVIRDSTEHQFLKRATVNILHNDSSVAQQSLSDDNGAFTITNLSAGNYILKISFSGYETRFSNFTIDSTNNFLNAGIIYMQQHAHQLQDVVVQTPPIIIKKDTVEFSA